jgi:bifunctional non-homologous end joining protein LigD
MSPRARRLVRRSVRRLAADLPTVEPIAPVRHPAAFDDPDWVFEPKYDGFRGLAYLTPDHCTIRSRRDIAFDRFDELAGTLRDQIDARDAILDGEIVALDRNGRPSFRELMRHTSTVAYAVFDVLWLNGRDLRPLPLERRKRLLDLAVPANTAHVMKVLSIESDGVALFKATGKLDLEGIVAKRRSDAYDRRAVWYKILNPAYSQKEGRAALFHRA